MTKGLEPHTRKHKLVYMIVTIELESSEAQLHSRLNDLEFGRTQPLHQLTVAELEDVLDGWRGDAAPRYQPVIDEMLRFRLKQGYYHPYTRRGRPRRTSFRTLRKAYEDFKLEHGREPDGIMRLDEVGDILRGPIVWERGDAPP